MHRSGGRRADNFPPPRRQRDCGSYCAYMAVHIPQSPLDLGGGTLVEVIASALAEVREHTVVGADGTEREVDTIIFATGSHVSDFPAARMINGREGNLHELWQGSPETFRGTTIAGFPNLFLLVGPNTGLGHTSIVYMIESQITYVLDCLRTMAHQRATVVDVRPEAQRDWNAAVQARMPPTVWNSGGCASWYLDANGRNSTLWPDFTFRFRQQTRRFDAESYRLERAGESATRDAPPLPSGT